MGWLIIIIAGTGLLLGYLSGFYGGRRHWSKRSYESAYIDALNAYISLSHISNTNVRLVIDPQTLSDIDKRVERELNRGVK